VAAITYIIISFGLKKEGFIELHRNRFAHALEIPVNTGIASIGLGVLATEATWGMVKGVVQRKYGLKLPEEAYLVDKAKVGIRALERGLEAADHELSNIGSAMIVQATVEAAKVAAEVSADKEIPQEVAHTLAAIAIQQGVQPHANPYVKEEVAEQFDQAVINFAAPSPNES
jgi:hypothetical protein